MSDVTFSALATAAYCPRKLYYRRLEADWDPPAEAEATKALAFRYGRLLAADDASLADAPIAVDPDTWRRNLCRARDTLDVWPRLSSPTDRERYLEGRDCRGVADKVLDDPAGVSLVSPGEPPPEGTWKPQRVRAVAAAKALAWERQAPVEHAYVEYPAHGVVRRVPLNGRRRAEYRRTLRAVRGMDGPPPRLRNRAKCRSCDYRERCGVRTRTLGSLLG
ncbi:MAG: hypothetical protein ABEJ92_01385 [Halobacteriales archaeon]